MEPIKYEFNKIRLFYIFKTDIKSLKLTKPFCFGSNKAKIRDAKGFTASSGIISNSFFVIYPQPSLSNLENLIFFNFIIFVFFYFFTYDTKF